MSPSPRHFARRILALGPFQALAGPPGARAGYRATLREVGSVEESLAALTRRFEIPTADDDPVFLLSAGWRSGSTLLQRLVLSSKKVLVYGEPYHRSGLAWRLADSVLPFTDMWPTKRILLDQSDDAAPSRAENTRLAQEWVANLYPPPADLAESHRALFRRLYAEPAAERGYPRWGFKEVRLSADHAFYLRWLFPRARIVFHYRDPYATWASFREYRGAYLRWPDRAVFTPRDFGHVWRDLVQGFLDAAERLDALTIRYEDLLSDPAARRSLADHVGADIDDSVLEVRRAGVLQQRADRSITRAELAMLRRQVEPLASRLGYPPPPRG